MKKFNAVAGEDDNNILMVMIIFHKEKLSTSLSRQIYLI